MTKAKVEVPGAVPAALPAGAFDGTGAAAPDDDVAAELAKLRAENAALKAAADKPSLPQVVYEPITPHGAERLAESEYAAISTNELMARIDAGQVREPRTGVLCKDGWYTPR